MSGCDPLQRHPQDSRSGPSTHCKDQFLKLLLLFRGAVKYIEKMTSIHNDNNDNNHSHNQMSNWFARLFPVYCKIIWASFKTKFDTTMIFGKVRLTPKQMTGHHFMADFSKSLTMVIWFHPRNPVSSFKKNSHPPNRAAYTVCSTGSLHDFLWHTLHGKNPENHLGCREPW